MKDRVRVSYFDRRHPHTRLAHPLILYISTPLRRTYTRTHQINPRVRGGQELRVLLVELRSQVFQTVRIVCNTCDRDGAADAGTPKRDPRDIAGPIRFAPRSRLVDSTDDGLLWEIELVSSLVPIRDFANRGNVAWKDGAEMDGESGMERDPAGNSVLSVGLRSGLVTNTVNLCSCGVRGPVAIRSRS